MEWACPTKKLIAEVLVASLEILLKAYVAEWPPKPVTHPVLLIHSHMGVYRNNGKANGTRAKTLP